MPLTAPAVTRTLLLANIGAFLAQLAAGEELLRWFALWPLGAPQAPGPGGPAGFLPWQLLTYGFLHGSALHIFVNLFGLYLFGSEVERVLGRRRYLVYYFACVLAAGTTQLIVSALSGGPAYPTIGASGAVFGLLLAYGIFFPRRIVVLIFPPVPMPARMFVVVYAAVELVLGVTGTQAGVAHFAHLGGMAGGYWMLRRWRRRRFDDM
ncbi:MAG TPA: rhomboid family intramembrane serine protease [Burkholderiales bacterium]|nr:rhomboid family intramembrane serine protease [Burkholderiales bacterium]